VQTQSDSKKDSPAAGGQDEQHAAWLETYVRSVRPLVVAFDFFALVSLVVAMRVLTWLLTGGAGAVGSVVGWASDPFVYVFNRFAFLPAPRLGPGLLELGSVLAVAAYSASTFGIWILIRRQAGPDAVPDKDGDDDTTGT